MGKVGRPPVYKTDQARKEAEERLKKQGERLTSLMKQNGINGAALAKAIYKSDKAVSQYKHGRHPIDPEDAKTIAQLLGVIPEYLIGWTDAKTATEEAILQERAFYESCDEETATRHEVFMKRKAMFSACGYLYECTGESAAYNFEGIAPGTSKPSDTCRLTAFDNSNDPYYFSFDELENLISELKNTIAFACFKKRHCSKDSAH